jgi:hypothetical protein
MDMQDKEFDKLFRSKLDDFEVEPSARVWQGIAGELPEGKRKKRSILPYLSIAASIIVLIAAGVLFISKRTEVAHHRPAKNNVAKIDNPSVINKTTDVVARTQAAQKPKTVLIAAAKTAPNNSNRSLLRQPIKQALTQSVQPALTANTAPHAAIIMKDDNKVIIDSTNLIAQQPAIQEAKPVLTGAILPVAENKSQLPSVKKHRIRSFGDMLNVVIAAVDKRKDKIVEFSDTDGDESTITGVNLGIIKVKKEN